MQGVGKEIQLTCRHHSGIQLSQGAGTGITGIGKQRFTLPFALQIDGGKGLIGDQGFTTHLHPRRRRFQLQAQRHRLNRAHIRGDLFAAAAIATGCCSHEHSVLIS